MPATIDRVDYQNHRDKQDLITLLDAYARDPMGGGEPLAQSTRDRLLDALNAFPGAVSFIARIDGDAVGLLNAFTGFSTFKAQPLLNIHDVAVLTDFRGKGIASQLLKAAENYATDLGCCKLTLEVLSGNTPAQSVYRQFGFEQYSLDPSAGTAEFWEKMINRID